MAFSDVNDGWAVGQGGVILHTTNGGTSWLTQSSGTAYDLFSVSFVDANYGWVVGGELETSEGNVTLHTTNGGSSWNTQSSGTTKSLRCVAFINANNGWAVGDSGTILYYH